MFATKRLTYSIITAEDAGDIFATLNNQETAEIISFLRWPMTMEQAYNWCHKAVQGFQNKTDYPFLVKYNGRPAGCIGLHLEQDTHGRAEIGYWVEENYKRQGFASEMAKGITEFAFQNIGMDELFATTAIGNEPSEKVLLKSGFTKTGTKDVPLPNGDMRSSKLWTLKKS